MASKVESKVDPRLIVARWAMGLGGVLLGGVGGGVVAYLTLISVVTFSITFVIVLVPMLFAFWLLIRWGLSKFVMRNAPPFYAELSVGWRAVMVAFLAGLGRLLMDMARVKEGESLSQVDGVLALLAVLIGGAIGASGAIYNNTQYRRRLVRNTAAHGGNSAPPAQD